MPLPNEHAARQSSPDKYIRIRRESDKLGKGIHVIWGVREEGGSEIQSIHFDAAKFTPDEARRWLKEHDFKTSLEEAVSAALILTMSSPAALAVSSPLVQDGVPRQRLKKELIKVGQYVIPKSGDKFAVSAGLLKHWAKTFATMRKAGIKVPVPASDSGGHSMNPKDTMGNVVDMFVEGQSLFGILEMVGADAISTALRNDVSIYSPADWKDGVGGHYNRPIIHVALTPYPVVPGLSGFETIAASLEVDMNWDKVRKAFSIESEMDEKTAEEVLLGAASLQTKTIDELKAEVEKLKKVIAKMKLSHEEESADTETSDAKEVDPVMASLVAENRRMKIQRLVKTNAITSGVGKDFVAIFADAEALQLSLSQPTDVFDDVLTALEKNVELLKLKEKTGPQLLELGRTLDTDGAEGVQKKIVEDATVKSKAEAPNW